MTAPNAAATDSDRRRILGALAALVAGGAVLGGERDANASPQTELAAKVLNDALETKDMAASLTKLKARKQLPAVVVASFESLTKQDLTSLAKFKAELASWGPEHKEFGMSAAGSI